MFLAAVCVFTAWVSAVGCAPGTGEDEARETVGQGVSRPGPWRLSAEIESIGNRQHVAYDGAPAWNPSNCAGGITPGAQQLSDYLRRRFRGISSIGGYACRANTADSSQMSVHGTGRALDIMIPMDHGDADNTVGDEIAAFLISNAEQIGVQYIIWDRSSWGAYRSAPKLQPYGGPIPHIDHIHAEITLEAARLNTSWFRDADGDGINNDRDNCLGEPNRGQEDTDGDGVGNACDNCARDRNRDQADHDRDGVGDVCDNCMREPNRMQEDGDSDGTGNACDNCPTVASDSQSDLDEDGRGNVCDPDLDGDGFANERDNCPRVSNAMQTDSNHDGVGDRCQSDDDGDGIADDRDNCPHAANADQADGDRDHLGDACDSDRDGDTVLNTRDNCAAQANTDQGDRDGDGLGDVCDSEPDGPAAPGDPDDGADPRTMPTMTYPDAGSDPGAVAGSDAGATSDAVATRDAGGSVSPGTGTTPATDGGTARRGATNTNVDGVGCSVAAGGVGRPGSRSGSVFLVAAASMCAFALRRTRRRRADS